MTFHEIVDQVVALVRTRQRLSYRALAREQGFVAWSGYGSVLQGWVLTEQGQVEEGLAKIHQGFAAFQSIEAEINRSYYLALLVEAYGNAGQVEEGLAALAEALGGIDKTGERLHEAELYRLKGELLLMQASSFNN